jgi:hypothetical protein
MEDGDVKASLVAIPWALFYKAEVRALSRKALLTWLEGFAHCRSGSTDGVIRGRLAEGAPALELVEAGLWSPEDVGSVIVNDYLKHNPSSSETEARREGTRRRMRKHRDAECNTQSDAVTSAVTSSVTSGAPGASPPSALPLSLSGSGLNSPDPESSPAISSDPKDLKASARDSETRANVLAVFLVWQAAFSPKAKLDKQRDARIRARLREGYSVEQLQQAIRNAQNDPHLMGETNGQKYTGLKTLLRDAEQVERLMALTSRPVAPAPRNGFRRHDDAPPHDRPLHPHEEARVQRILASAKGTA